MRNKVHSNVDTPGDLLESEKECPRGNTSGHDEASRRQRYTSGPRGTYLCHCVDAKPKLRPGGVSPTASNQTLPSQMIASWPYRAYESDQKRGMEGTHSRAGTQ